MLTLNVLLWWFFTGKRKSRIGSYKGKHHGGMRRDGMKNIWVGNYIPRLKGKY